MGAASATMPLWSRWLLAFLAAMLMSGALGSAANAHKQHRIQQQQQQAAQAAQARQSQPGSPGQAMPAAMHDNMSEMMEENARPPMTFAGRFLDWLGRLHPIIVHFPIAFFPAALFTAIVGRRRPAFGAPVQFLVVAGGIIAPVSALLGWFNAGFSLTDSDPLMAVHRCLGTGIGAGGLVLGVWAWRRPWEDRGAGMIVALTLMTAAIVAQGWFGGALVHGIDHMDW